MDQNQTEIKVKYLSEKEILPKAEEFLKKYNPNEVIPVPLERIIEKDLGVNILTVKGLKDLIDCDGFIDSDFKTITFDDFAYNDNEARVLFTIAHELGHLVLHQDLYSSHKINNSQSLRDFQSCLGEIAWKRLEIQANIFAGFILFPYKPLAKLINDNIEHCGGLEKFNISDLQRLANDIQLKFGASERACYIQLEKYFPKLIAIAKDTIF